MKNRTMVKVLCGLLMLSMLLVMAGCGEKEEASSEKVTLKVGMLGTDIKTACYILANELGYFEEENLDVQFEKVNSLPDGVTAVSMDKIDILPYGVIPSCSFISQGTDVVIFGGTISEGSEGISLEETKITSLDQLKGKKIGCFRMETGHMVLKGLLRDAGIEDGKDVDFIYLDSQQSIVEAVKKGEVNLGIVNTGFGYVAKQGGLNVAFQVGEFEADFPCCRQTASRTAVTEKRDALVRLEKALLKAYAVYLNEQDTAIELLAKYSGQEESYVKAVMYGTDDYDNAMIVSLDPNKKKVSDFYEVMKANGDIANDTEYDINDYIDTSIYQDALQLLIDAGEDKELYEQLMKEFLKNND